MLRGIARKGRQLFIFNFYKNILVQHTMPVEGQHRLEVLTSNKDLFAHINYLVPLKPVSKYKRLQNLLPSTDFMDIQRLTKSDKSKAKEHLKSFGFAEDRASLMAEALSNPAFTLSMICLTIKRDKITNGMAFGVFASEDSSWGIWPGKNKSEIVIFPVDSDDVCIMLQKWLDSGKSTAGNPHLQKIPDR